MLMFASLRYVLIPPIVVEFGAHKKESTDDSQRDKNFVSIFVVRRILFLVHLFGIVSIPNRECIPYPLVAEKEGAERQGLELTLALAMLLNCTDILYNADATVRVRTDPAFREVKATTTG